MTYFDKAVTVENSSAFDLVAYSSEDELLLLRFKDGADVTYNYSPEQWATLRTSLLEASLTGFSLGRFFHEEIKPIRYSRLYIYDYDIADPVGQFYEEPEPKPELVTFVFNTTISIMISAESADEASERLAHEGLRAATHYSIPCGDLPAPGVLRTNPING